MSETAADHERTAEVLNAAADLIGAHNWGTKVMYRPATDAFCLRGSIQAAYGVDPSHLVVGHPDVGSHFNRTPAERAVEKVIGTEAVWQWNDFTCKSQQQAEDTLRAAAKSELRLADSVTP